VLVYTTPPLPEPVEVTGLPVLTLFAATSAPDTDWTATLVDVHPDGTAVHITEGIVRARFRESDVAPSLVVPGAVVEYRVELWETCNLFKAGHCIRLEVLSQGSR
jgi:putative CocE/NonD family hydrolase